MKGDGRQCFVGSIWKWMEVDLLPWKLPCDLLKASMEADGIFRGSVSTSCMEVGGSFHGSRCPYMWNHVYVMEFLGRFHGSR